jgi:hypothetical protein
LWEKVARASAPDEGFYQRALLAVERTPHPAAMLRIASTLSHKGRGEAVTNSSLAWFINI